jgi:hypothetical protein
VTSAVGSAPVDEHRDQQWPDQPAREADREADRRRERVRWVWTFVGVGVFLAVFVWVVVLSFTRTGP